MQFLKHGDYNNFVKHWRSLQSFKDVKRNFCYCFPSSVFIQPRKTQLFTLSNAIGFVKTSYISFMNVTVLAYFKRKQSHCCYLAFCLWRTRTKISIWSVYNSIKICLLTHLPIPIWPYLPAVLPPPPPVISPQTTDGLRLFPATLLTSSFRTSGRWSLMFSTIRTLL